MTKKPHSLPHGQGSPRKGSSREGTWGASAQFGPWVTSLKPLGALPWERSSAPSRTRPSTGPAASTRRPASPSNTTRARTSRSMRGSAISTPMRRLRRSAPRMRAATTGGLAPIARTRLIYIPALSNCATVTIDREKHNKERGWSGGLSTVTERTGKAASPPPIGSSRRSRKASTCHTRTLRARFRPAAVLCS